MHLVPIGETVAERFLLLPSVGVAGWLGCVAIARLSGNVRRIAVACVLVAGLFATIARANLWRDETALWEDAATHHPLSAQAWAGWGDAFRHAGRPSEAIPRYERALELAPGMTAVRQTLAAAHDAMERPDRALAEARKAVELDSDDPVALNNLGARLARIHRLEEADRLYQKAIEVAPRYAPALRNAAIAALSLGRPEEAAALLDRAEAVDPELPGLDALRARLRATPNASEGR
jgi:tetratricopeptide (TPR) repeat protein